MRIQDFWRDVIRRPAQSLLLTFLTDLQLYRKPEVDDANLSIFRQQDVPQLQVSVHHAFLLHAVDAVCDLCKHLPDRRLFHQLLLRFEPFDLLVQFLALDVLHQ